MSNVKSDLVIETSPALQNLFYDYTHLPIGGKEVICPYWKNDLERGVFGPYGGKGKPEQIVGAAEKEAKTSGVDLNGLSEEEILSFMKSKRIGVDCSGFDFWMLDVLDREKGGSGIADDIPQAKGRFLQARANVRMLTDEKVAIPVKIADIRFGDMIRLRKGAHVAVVISLSRDENGVLKEIVYAHSSSPQTTLISGVHRAIIEVRDPLLELGNQAWHESSSSGKNYGQVSFFPDFGDGPKRLRIWF